MVEGVFSRGSRLTIRPIELGRRVVREMDDQRSVDVNGRRVVPNHFVVKLSQKDYDGFAGIKDVLVTELVEAAREYARAENYHFLGPVAVQLEVDKNTKPGRFDVVASLQQQIPVPAAPTASPTPAPAAVPPAAPPIAPIPAVPSPPAVPVAPGVDQPAAAAAAAAGAVAGAADAALATTAATHPENDYSAFAPAADAASDLFAPSAEASSTDAAGAESPSDGDSTPAAVLRATSRLVMPNGQQHTLGDEVVSIGRVSENTIPVADPNVSRRHAEVRPNRNSYVVVDLGSTNGTLVNGTRIHGETVLSDGDIISLGTTYIRFESN